MKNNLFRFIQGETHLITDWHAKMSLTVHEPIWNVLCSTFHSISEHPLKTDRTWKILYAKTTNFRPKAMLTSRINYRGLEEEFFCVEMATTKTNQVVAFSTHIHPCICRMYKQRTIFLYFNTNLSKILWLDLVVQTKLKPRQVAAILESSSLLLLLISSLSKLCTGMKHMVMNSIKMM